MSYTVCIHYKIGGVFQEAEEMMGVVDRNGDGLISYSELRCMMGANPILLCIYLGSSLRLLRYLKCSRAWKLIVIRCILLNIY